MDSGRYGPQRLSIELVDVCNLHCSYCLRDEEALYGHKAHFMELSLLERVLPEARLATGLSRLTFTGGEPTLHPKFGEILALAGANGLKASFVTNGWNFERVWPALLAAKESLSHVAFSLDGASAADHDHWRGEGSFRRLVSAFARCYRAGLPFVIKAAIRRDTVPKLEQLAMFAARVGAHTLSFSHLLPTSSHSERQFGLSVDERMIAEQEIASLARIFKMKITLDVGYFNIDPRAPCSPLAGTSCNIDYRGRLTLCCNLSGFRGSTDESDVVADLHTETYVSAHRRLRQLAELQVERRANSIKQLQKSKAPVDLYTGSPCLFCLKSFGKTPWHTSAVSVTPNPTVPVSIMNRSNS